MFCFTFSPSHFFGDQKCSKYKNTNDFLLIRLLFFGFVSIVFIFKKYLFLFWLRRIVYDSSSTTGNEAHKSIKRNVCNIYAFFGLLSNLSINRRKLVDSMWWVVSLSLSLNFFRVADDNSMVLDVEGMKSITNCVNQFNRLVILYVFRVWWCDEWVRMWVSSVSVVNVWELNLLDSTILCSSIEVFCIWGLR